MLINKPRYIRGLLIPDKAKTHKEVNSMSFLVINRRKLLTAFVIWAVIYPVLLLTSYTKTHDLHSAIHSIGFFALFTIISMIVVAAIGIINFYTTRSLLARITESPAGGLFDNNNYTLTLRHQQSYFLFTRPELHGTISSYPVVASVTASKPVGLQFSFTVNRTTGIYAGNDRPEILLLSNFDNRFLLQNNIPAEVENFVAQLQAKGFQPPPAPLP